MFRQKNAYRTPDFTNCDPNEEFVCPYDSNHKIRAKRFPYHLKNCRKNFPLSNMAHCPFNARHVVPGPEYKYHLTNCPDKRVIEQDIAYEQQKQNGEESPFKGCTDVPPYNTWEPPPSSEDWDAEMRNEPNYDYTPPTDAGQHIYRSTCGMTPAEKRAHREYLKRQEERRKAGLPPEPEFFGGEAHCGVPELVRPSSQPPLRLPREPPKAYQHVNQMAMGGENTQLGLVGLGRGLLMNKQMMMVNDSSKADGDLMKTKAAMLPTAQGFGRGMAANFKTEPIQTNGHAVAPAAQTYVRTVGRGRGGTPQNRNRQLIIKTAPTVGGLAGQKTQTSYAINKTEPSKHEEENNDVKTSQLSSGDSSSQEESEDTMRKKLIRKLMKKLNGIKILEMKKEEGKELTEEEELKVSKKASIQKEIAVLGHEA
ncbi:uncharacterized protein LOC117106877 isoform X2 [Anneissia japonica]|nr:uncharacterized protein LOC117106877 isoform X2 [Anneissia japonica]XP_033104272.1 uncharacterized protein LOC117106877 isoform X2 [Anneissia japonica]XP_033104273.1 uncharacterized protein LOC117106877 isoform X2 [Anneissia japonica]